MPQTVGFRSSALLQPNQDTGEKMKKKPNRKENFRRLGKLWKQTKTQP